MKRAIALLILQISQLAYAIDQPSYDQRTHRIPNWEEQAKAHLNISSETLRARMDNRCIMLNNYWCLKDFGWAGSVGKDEDSHAVFSNGYYAARAAVRNARTAYGKHGRKSSLAIMEAYAPSSDCIGSNRAKLPDGTCKYGKNNPSEYAKVAAKGITEDINADLGLFDKNKQATGNLVIFLINMSAFELNGPRVQESTIKKGICLEDSTCTPNDQDQ